MKKNVIGAILAALILPFIFSCDPDTVPYKVFCSINGDGTGFRQSDYSLHAVGHSKTFYISDDLVFHLGDSIVKTDLSTGSDVNLLPNYLIITDKEHLGIDRDHGLLYFAANDAIWKMGFAGDNLERISSSDYSVYYAPALSSCGNYLTAIKDSHVVRLDLSSGVWIDLPRPISARYAVYCGDTDEYYCYCPYTESYSDKVALCKFNGSTQDSTQIISDYFINPNNGRNNLCTGFNQRYFTLHSSQDPWLSSSWIGYSNWERYYSTLWVYDRQTGTLASIPECFSFSFVGDSDVLLYSRLKFGMSDLMRMDLSSGLSTMIWDGYFAPRHYSFSVRNIYPRYDGQKIHIDTWEKAQ